MNRDDINERFTNLASGTATWDQPAAAPYGPPVKVPMSGQAKAVFAVAGLVIVGGSAMGVAAFSASSGEAEARTQELALQAQQLEVEKAKVNAPDAKAEERRIAGFQACLEKAGTDKDVCAQAFPAPGAATFNAANTSSASDSGHGGGIGVNGGLIVGLGVVVGVGFWARKSTKGSNAA